MEEAKETVTQQEENIQITFTIGRPRNEKESEFDALIFRLLRVNDYLNNMLTDEIDTKNHNKNIEEIQRLLENFKIEEV